MSTPPTYSHVVEVNGPHRTVYLAGQTGVDATGKVAEGFRAQAVQVMENIKMALASVGGGFEHVVKLTSYLTNIDANGAEFREIRGSYFPNKAALPASTLLQVPRLASRRICSKWKDRDPAESLGRASLLTEVSGPSPDRFGVLPFAGRLRSSGLLALHRHWHASDLD
jgi:enamine deaminase RidA (YjgF/YER057c/UK114 family)